MHDWAISFRASKGSGLRLGVKDLIDVEGIRTSAGSRLVLSRSMPAEKDALLLAGSRHQNVQIVAKTNLNELAFGATGINPWFGTPMNPLNPNLIPGGSSSGSAAGVATGELDVAFGSDTGGSIRIPSACCGVFGLKTTFGRIPLEGVWPLAPSLDSVGPLAANVQMLEIAMQLLEPGFAKVPISKPKVAVLDNSGSPEVLAGIEAVLGLVTTSVTRIGDPGLDSAREAGLCLMFVEALESNRGLLDESHRLDPAVVGRFLKAASFLEPDVNHATEIKEIFTARLNDRLGVHDFLALPTLRIPVPSLNNAGGAPLNANTMPFNLAGLPAISIPVPVTRSLINTLNLDLSQLNLGFTGDGAESMPISLQIVGPMASEEELIGFAQIIESALGDV